MYKNIFYVEKNISLTTQKTFFWFVTANIEQGARFLSPPTLLK